MKFFNLTDIDGFFAAVEKCTGKVELVTSEGDRLNLKSKLCQYVAFTKLLSGGNVLEMEIVTYNPDDAHRLINFMVREEYFDIEE